MTPHWVPPLMSQIVNETFSHYENRLYAVFENDFIVSHPHYRGLPVHVSRMANGPVSCISLPRKTMKQDSA